MDKKEIGMESNFDEIINRYKTNSVKYDLIANYQKPQDVLPMWVADMDFKVPQCVEDAVRKVVDHGIYGYSTCPDSYYEAVIHWFKEYFHTIIERNWIVTTPGIVNGVGLAIRAFTKEEDAILIQRPVYYPFSNLIEKNNRKLVNNPLINNQGYYEMDYQDMEKKIIEYQVKMFILCSPHNPIGRVWKKEELTKATEICKKHNVIIVSDEIHCDFVFPGHQHHMLIQVAPEMKDQIITCTAPSKTFNLAGMQTSNIIISNPIRRQKFVDEVEKVAVGMVGPMGMAACEAAYRGGREWLNQLLSYLEGNREYIREFLKAEIPEIKMSELEGTYLIWFNFSELGLSNEDLEDLVVNKMKIWFDAGTMFGEEGSGYERMNIACPRSVLEKAMNQIKDEILNIRKNK